MEVDSIKMQMEIVKDFSDKSEIEIKTGPFGTQLKASEYQSSGTPVLNVKNLGFSTINTEKLDMVGDATVERLKAHLLKAGDIVFGRKGAVERHAFISVNEEGWMQGSDCIRLRVKTDMINPRFLSYYFLTKEHRAFMISMCSHGTTMASLNQKILEQICFPMPRRNVQDKIVHILERIDRKIVVNNRINDNLFEQMQVLYKAWFIDFLPFGGLKPGSWTQTDIYSLADIIYGAPFASKQFNTEGEGKPIIRIRDLKNQQFATYTTEVHPKGYLLQLGDIVVGMDGEFRPYIWGNDEAWLNQRVCVFENKRPSGKAFLYFTIKPLLYAIEQTQVATTVIHIGKKDYDSFEIVLPDVSTLDSFDALTLPMVKQIVANSFENKRLVAMRDALLPKLMSGEIDVSAIQI